MSNVSSPFKSKKGEAAYLAAYEASMRLWPVPYESMDIPSRFGSTHLVVCGPKDAPPLVLLHGYLVSLTMWAYNVADLSHNYRVYALDVMGQPSKSTPEQAIGSRADHVEWLTATLDALRIERAYLAGMSYGGWLALNYAITTPEQVQKLVLLSPDGPFVPNSQELMLRSMPMSFFPKRFLVESFMHWCMFKENLQRPDIRLLDTCMVDQMWLGLKHFRMQPETLKVAPVPFTDDELRAMQVPTLLLIGQQEVLFDPVAALERARKLIPNLEGELVPRANHLMTAEQHERVNQRVLEFLKGTAQQPLATGATLGA
jgi:pimeloyl-ACP methyl ester carboxylesterase